MGVARILKEYGEGKYQIRLEMETSRIMSERAGLYKRVELIDDEEKPALEESLKAARTVVDEAMEKRNEKAEEYNNHGRHPALLTILAEQVKTMQAAVADWMVLKRRLNMLLLERETALRRIRFIEDFTPGDLIMDAWCVDGTIGLEGTVGTIEIPGELRNGLVMIAAGGSFYRAINGWVQPVISSMPATYIFNYCLMPAWQRFQPTYRTGVITSLDGGVCDVSLHKAISSIRPRGRAIDINAANSLQGVPIEYRDGMNGAAFEVGNKVVVRFVHQSWENPVVIGFMKNAVTKIWAWFRLYATVTQSMTHQGVDLEPPQPDPNYQPWLYKATYKLWVSYFDKDGVALGSSQHEGEVVSETVHVHTYLSNGQPTYTIRKAGEVPDVPLYLGYDGDLPYRGGLSWYNGMRSGYLNLPLTFTDFANSPHAQIFAGFKSGEIDRYPYQGVSLDGAAPT